MKVITHQLYYDSRKMKRSATDEHRCTQMIIRNCAAMMEKSPNFDNLPG